tara:strand:+ start:1036 stop:1785 length:750 start_codon:yes stop_codon:yes gene_type:complete
MSLLEDLNSLIVRETVHPPLVTKGSELTYAEWDARTIAIFDAIQEITSGANVTAYNPATTYDDSDPSIYLQYAGYDSKIWKAIGTFTGQTPAEGIYWTRVALANVIPDVLRLVDAANNCECLHSASLTIATADVLTLNSVQQLFGLTIPTGYSADLISATVSIVFNTTPYATNTELEVAILGANVPFFRMDCLGASVTTTRQLMKYAATGATDVQITTASDIVVTTRTGDPTAGNSDIEVFVLYRLIPV